MYNITFAARPVCDCPDCAPLCKHLLYLKLRVLRIPRGSPLLRSLGYAPHELRYIFAHMAAAGAVEAPEARAVVAAALGVRLSDAPLPPPIARAPAGGGGGAAAAGGAARAAAAAGGVGAYASTVPPAARGLDDEEDECAVCFDVLGGGAGLFYCSACTHALHGACYAAWRAAKAAAAVPVTCVFCRAVWGPAPGAVPPPPPPLPRAAAAGAGGGAGGGGGGGGGAAHVTENEGYMNVASVLGLPAERDVSTYSPFSGGHGSYGRYGGGGYHGKSRYRRWR